VIPDVIAARAAEAQALGLTPVYRYKYGKGIAAPGKPVGGVDVACGPYGTRSLVRLDLDRAGMLGRVLAVAGPQLAARLLVLDAFQTPGHNDVLVWVQGWRVSSGAIFDPETGEKIGDVFAEGGRAHFDTPILQGSWATIPTVTRPEFDRLLSPWVIRWRGESSGADWQHHKQNGAQLIAGWERVERALVEQVIAYGMEHQTSKFRDIRARLDQPGANRSAEFGNLVQSVMLLVTRFGSGIADRCRLAAAVVVVVGAGGKEREKNYKIEQDAGVLVSKIIEGAARDDGSRWIIPSWAQSTPRPAMRPSAPQAAPEPPRRGPGRPLGDADKRRAKLRRILTERVEDNADGRIYYYASDLAESLGCAERTLQRYLEELVEAKLIRRGQEGGRGGRGWIELASPEKWKAARGAKNCPKRPDEQAFARGDSPIADEGSTAPQTAIETPVCKDMITDTLAPQPAAEAPQPARAAPPASFGEPPRNTRRGRWADGYTQTPGERIAKLAEAQLVEPAELEPPRRPIEADYDAYHQQLRADPQRAAELALLGAVLAERAEAPPQAPARASGFGDPNCQPPGTAGFAIYQRPEVAAALAALHKRAKMLPDATIAPATS
jgi:hypothetical protein